MHRWPADLRSCANASQNTRSPPCRPRRLSPENGLIKLTTTLLHISGEWIASDWPVCQVNRPPDGSCAHLSPTLWLVTLAISVVERPQQGDVHLSIVPNLHRDLPARD